MRISTWAAQFATKIGGRIPDGWTYYSDANGITFNQSSALVQKKGRYVSFWESRPMCTTVDGGRLYVPGVPSRTVTKCKVSYKEKTYTIKECIEGHYYIRCGNSGGCHSGIASSYVRAPANICLVLPPSSLPSCCTNGNCGSCTPQDWDNWREEQKCLPTKQLELCIYYDCCNHQCDRAIFEAVKYFPAFRTGTDENGNPEYTPASEEVFLTANLNNGSDGGPRGPFCAPIPAGKLYERTNRVIYPVTECWKEVIAGTPGYTQELPDRTFCTIVKFAVVLDIKDSGETFSPTSTYEGGVDAVPSGQVFFSTFSNNLPNPTSFGEALAKMYAGAQIRRPSWPAGYFIQDAGGGIFKLIGGASLPNAEDMAAGDWVAFGGSSSSVSECRTLQTLQESKIKFSPPIFYPSVEAEPEWGDGCNVKTMVPSDGHNGRKLDGERNRFGFNFKHTFPKSNRVRKIYGHLPIHPVFGQKLTVLFSEVFNNSVQIGDPEMEKTKLYISFGDGSIDGINVDGTAFFNRDSVYGNGWLCSSQSNGILSPIYGKIWHFPWKNFGIDGDPYLETLVGNTNANVREWYSNLIYEDFENYNFNYLPHKIEFPIHGGDIVKFYLVIPAREVETEIYFMANSKMEVLT